MTDAIAKKIAAHGWAVVNVPGDESLPAYAYSVGLQDSFAHPEVIVFGLDERALHGVVNAVGDAVRAGHRFADHDESDAVLDGYRCAFRAVTPAAVTTFMGKAVERREGEVAALHCLWPDREGRFPWQRGTSPEYRRLQPMLSDGPEPFTRARPARAEG